MNTRSVFVGSNATLQLFPTGAPAGKGVNDSADESKSPIRPTPKSRAQNTTRSLPETSGAMSSTSITASELLRPGTGEIHDQLFPWSSERPSRHGLLA